MTTTNYSNNLTTYKDFQATFLRMILQDTRKGEKGLLSFYVSGL